MQWMIFLGTTAFLGLVLLLPGLALSAIGLRLRGGIALSFAPVASLGIIAIATIVTPLLGLRWGIPSIILMTVVLLVAALALRQLWPHESDASGWWSKPADWSTYATMALAAVIITIAVALIIKTPIAVSGTWDNITHLTTARFISESGDAFPLLPADFRPGSVNYIHYPTVWHSIVALPVITLAAPMSIASNAAMTVVAGLLWPASCIYLVRAVISDHPGVLLATGALAASFPSFPYLLVDYGVLFPTLTAYAGMPAVLALAAQVCGCTRVPGPGVPLAVTMLAIAAAGVVLAHPRVSVGAGLMVLPLLLAAVIRSLRIREPRKRIRASALWGFLLVAYTGVLALVWYMSRPTPSYWNAETSVLGGILDALTAVSKEIGSPWLVLPLMFVGALVALRDSRVRWILGAFVVLAAAWTITISMEHNFLRRVISAPWNEQAPRILALLPLFYVPIAALGVHRILQTIERWRSEKRGRDRTLLPDVSTASLITTVIITAAVFLTPTAVPRAIERAQNAYEYAVHPCVYPDTSCLLTADEAAILESLGDYLDETDVIVTSPLNGSGMAYGIHGWKTSWPAMTLGNNRDASVLVRNLSLGPSAAVCDSIANLGATYVLDFGDELVHAHHKVDYEGMRGFENEPQWFTLVAQEGEAKLYRIDMCWDIAAAPSG